MSTRDNNGSDLHPQPVVPALLPVYPQILLFPLNALQILACSLLMGFGHQLRHKAAVMNLCIGVMGSALGLLCVALLHTLTARVFNSSGKPVLSCSSPVFNPWCRSMC